MNGKDLNLFTKSISAQTGPTSFNELKIVDGVFYSSYRAAAQAYGLLEGDNPIEECLQEASTFQMPYALPRFFVTRLRTYGSNQKLVHYKTISDIAHIIEPMGKHQADFDLPTVSYEDIPLCKSVKEIEEELNIPISLENIFAVSKLNTCQKEAY
ncbi:hypothetical protein RJ640_026013 [Escallonia rubra]|uniref:Uncharacterized protein n=1 Tax=Escallonia rubra TaxID=112253 RepID=A0AA88UDS1_9ASTE|nr:hypothetical protein RJ640_026013 [Escallonia rubra]